jgi:DNA helicase-2/ATP-dependent DNA helicase PcrA
MSDGEPDEHRVFGPPGTGKTTFLSKAVNATARSRGTSRMVVASFTRAAAEEIAGRGLHVDQQHVGTLHSLAYRALDRPNVAQEHVDDWNRQYPAYRMTAQKSDGEAPVAEVGKSTDGDQLLSQVDALRARMIPEELWPTSVRAFNHRWEQFKTSEGCVDFTDMISLAVSDVDEAPGSPIVGFFDESQDFTVLELTLVRKWGRHMERIVTAGDDDQTLYQFKGASPEAFLDPPVPDGNKRVLRESHRVPRAVHAASQDWVGRLSRREPKGYEPREAEGAVRITDAQYREGEQLARQVEREAEADRTVMVLASCAYMLDPVKHAMKSRGLPFHNPLRPARTDWNPLKPPSRGTATADRVLSYLIIDERMFGELSRLWTGGDVRRWTHLVKTQGTFVRGARTAISDLPDRELSFDEVAALFDDEREMEEALQPSLDWLERNLLASKRGPARFPIEVARKRGGMALSEPPRVTIGTIHSTKGSEAQVVFLLPDLSMAAYREWSEPGARRDSVVRLMYVGMTRPSEELVVCTQSSPLSVDPRLLARGAHIN